MSKINFDEVVEALSCGREVEFTYQGKLYTILHTPRGRYVVCDHEVVSDYFMNPQDLISSVRIEEKSLEVIIGSSDSISNFTVF